MAGRGSRLRPHTLTVPKPLIPVAGQPIVHRLVKDIVKVLNQPIEEIAFILESARLNKGAAEFALQKGKSYGHGLGKMLHEVHQQKMMGEGLFPVILSYTAAACDARMAGAMVPVMSNSGSGNQGIAATLPVVVYAEKNGITEDRLIRALMLSHLTVIYIKQSLGRLSALCGCVVAATGSS